MAERLIEVVDAKTGRNDEQTRPFANRLARVLQIIFTERMRNIGRQRLPQSAGNRTLLLAGRGQRLQAID